jgi:primosomal protein N'
LYDLRPVLQVGRTKERKQQQGERLAQLASKGQLLRAVKFVRSRRIMAVLVAATETLLTPWNALEQYRYSYCNVASHSHQHVVQGHTSCLDSDTDNDHDLHDELLQTQRLSLGLKNYGCSHYRRRCRIRAPCCNEVFDCRHCHNDVKNVNEPVPSKRHEMPRHLVERVICSLCNHEQDVQQVCENCGVRMGEYFCSICKFFDDEVDIFFSL